MPHVRVVRASSLSTTKGGARLPDRRSEWLNAFFIGADRFAAAVFDGTKN